MDINLGGYVDKPHGNGYNREMRRHEVVEVSKARNTVKLMSLDSGKVHWVSRVDLENAVDRDIWQYAEKVTNAYDPKKTYYTIQYNAVMDIKYIETLGEFHKFSVENSYGYLDCVHLRDDAVLTVKPAKYRACITREYTKEATVWATSLKDAKEQFDAYQDHIGGKITKIAKVAKVPESKKKAYC